MQLTRLRIVESIRTAMDEDATSTKNSLFVKFSADLAVYTSLVTPEAIVKVSLTTSPELPPHAIKVVINLFLFITSA
jgi:hypothetical protein